MDFSPIQIAIVALIVLLVFGPKRLPELGKSLGNGIREFKDSVTGRDDESPPQLPPAEDDPPVSSGTTRRDAASS